MIRVTRTLVRELPLIDRHTGQPVVLILEPGSRVLKLKVKGRRRRYWVSLEQLWHQAAVNRVVFYKSWQELAELGFGPVRFEVRQMASQDRRPNYIHSVDVRRSRPLGQQFLPKRQLIVGSFGRGQQLDSNACFRCEALYF